MNQGLGCHASLVQLDCEHPCVNLHQLKDSWKTGLRRESDEQESHRLWQRRELLCELAFVPDSSTGSFHAEECQFDYAADAVYVGGWAANILRRCLTIDYCCHLQGHRSAEKSKSAFYHAR